MIVTFVAALIPLIKPFLKLLAAVGFIRYLKSLFPNISYSSSVRLILAVSLGFLFLYTYSFVRSVLYGRNKGLIT